MPCGGVSKRLRSRGLPRLHVAGLIMLAMILFSQYCLDWASSRVLRRGFKEEEPAGSSSNIFPREKGIESALLGSAFALSIMAGECLQALFGVWLQALFPLSMAYGISHFHAVRRGVEAAQALLPCLDSGLTCLTLLRSKRSRARCHSSWL